METAKAINYRHGSYYMPAKVVLGVSAAAAAVSILAMVWIYNSSVLSRASQGAYFIGATGVGSLSFIAFIVSAVVLYRQRKIPIFDEDELKNYRENDPQIPTTGEHTPGLDQLSTDGQHIADSKNTPHSP